MSATVPSDVLDKAVAGDRTALERLVRTIRPNVERQLVRYPVSDDDRRDLLQGTLVQIVRKLSSFRAESSFSTWLFRVTANEALMLMRSRRRHRARVVEGVEWEELGALPAAGDGAAPSVENLAEVSQRDERVRSAMEALPDDYRSVVVAHYHEDLGLQQIAERLRITESAVRSRLHRARARLKALLQADGGFEATQAA